MAEVLFHRSSGLRVDGLDGDVGLKTVIVEQDDSLLIHSIAGYGVVGLVMITENSGAS